MINTEKLKVGDTLIAKDECIMDGTAFWDRNKPALIPGKEYKINHIIPRSKTIVVSSEVDAEHLFTTECINQFFTIKQ
jgi:hypothetical protein